MARVALVHVPLALAALGLHAPPSVAQPLPPPSVAASVEGTRITYRVTGLPALAADHRTLVTTLTEPPGAVHPELTVVFTDITTNEVRRRIEVITLGNVVPREGGGLVQVEGDITARAREANEALRELRVVTIGPGSEQATLDLARGTSEVALDTATVRARNGRLQVTEPGDPRTIFLDVPLPRPATLTPACRRVVRPYVTAAWFVGTDWILVRTAFTSGPTCPAPASGWFAHEVVLGM